MDVRMKVEERTVGLNTKDATSISVLHAQGFVKILFDGKIGTLDLQF